MDESFELPVFYNNKEILLPAQLHQYGYTYKIEVDVNGIAVFFERDEEKNWRAILDPSSVDNNPHISKEQLQAIAESLQQLFD